MGFPTGQLSKSGMEVELVWKSENKLEPEPESEIESEAESDSELELESDSDIEMESGLKGE